MCVGPEKTAVSELDLERLKCNRAVLSKELSVTMEMFFVCGNMAATGHI